MQSSPSTRFACLVVDDDAAFASLVAGVVRAEGGDPTVCHDVASARAAAQAKPFALALLDNHLPDGKGYDFFAQFSRANPDAPAIMITGIPDLGEAVALTRNGLFDYLTKPLDVDVLTAALCRAKLRLASTEPSATAGDFFGESPAMHAVRQQLAQAARHPGSTVLLTGETGSGKDMAARELHRLTFGDKPAPYVAVNCGAVPAEMFESELFGAERGAFTGADKRRAGLVAAAQGGTLFLDEIAEVPLALQAKLLRLLEGGEYRALGSTEPQKFTGRFVAATNRNLADEVKAGRFREDLLYRFDVFTVELPPLRARRDEIPGLAERLLAGLAAKYRRITPLVQAADLAALQAHSFPGNVRELRNILERSLLKTADDSKWHALDRNWTSRGATSTPPSASAPAVPPPDRQLAPIEEQEYRMIQQALAETRGGIRRAAAKLGLSPQALLRRLEKWPELRPPTDSAKT